MNINHIFKVATTQGNLEDYFHKFGISPIDLEVGDTRVKKLMGIMPEDSLYFVMMSYSGPKGYYDHNTIMSVMGPDKEKAQQYFSKLEQKVSIKFSEPPQQVKKEQDKVIDLLNKSRKKELN